MAMSPAASRTGSCWLGVHFYMLSVAVTVVIATTATHGTRVFTARAASLLLSSAFKAVWVGRWVLRERGSASGCAEGNIVVTSDAQCGVIHGHATHRIKQLRHFGILQLGLSVSLQYTPPLMGWGWNLVVCCGSGSCLERIVG